MKIAHLVCVYPPYRGGIGNVAYNYYTQLRQLGLDVHVYTPAYQHSAQTSSDRHVFYEKPWLSYGNGAFLPQLLWRLNTYDIVHLHYPFFGASELVWLRMSLARSRCRLVLHYHMDTLGLSPVAKLLAMPARVIEASLFHQASAITCASLDYVKHSAIAKLYDKYQDKFYEVPFGVEQALFRPSASSASKKQKIIFFIANLDQAHYFKGLEVLLSAFNRLKSTDAVLRIGGEGDLRGKYESECRALGLDKRVVFLGKLTQAELVRNYQEASMTVLPSINGHEAFGLVLIESMACGTPVLASDLPGVRRVFTDGQEGVLCLTGDAADLAAKLDYMLSEADLDKMGASGATLVRTKYSWSKAAADLAAIYKKILS